MKLIEFIYLVFLLPHWLCYYFSEDKGKIDKDVELHLINWKLKRYKYHFFNIIQVIITCKEYRNIFYLRISDISVKLHLCTFLEFILPKNEFIKIGTKRENFGYGAFIEHGNSTIIHANKIGKYLWINQNVTIGNNGRGIPTIGDNVRIGTGSVVLGPINIGNNVTIGANSTIVKDVPDNCTVVSNESFIIKMNGKRTRIRL